ncbi:MAG: 50S ribosomal protein L11 methyltransferase [Saprospiraceae bacterium]|nr:50S ribosomal protein L11 methyltransferase [Saprospiraceae bacterium]MCB9353926.1 50S ribosomal protein L11 methyltransferase [Lewinellaceae bacterium]
MDYWKYILRANPETADILVAYLADAPFDTFEETEDGLNAYAPAHAPEEEIHTRLEALKQQFDFSWERSFLPSQNWNAVWESNFPPVIVGNFCAVRADFHDPIPGVQHELVINPKMAFGTGHHETTWQCLAALEHLPVQDARLLDFGCGTGVLAILADRLGAASVEAVDIEEEAYRNTLENCAANDAKHVTARCGTLDAVEGRDFDGILANINRNVILDALPSLAAMTRAEGWLLVSGILEQDDVVVTTAAEAAGFKKQRQTQRGNWLCIEFRKNLPA